MTGGVFDTRGKGFNPIVIKWLINYHWLSYIIHLIFFIILHYSKDKMLRRSQKALCSFEFEQQEVKRCQGKLAFYKQNVKDAARSW